MERIEYRQDQSVFASILGYYPSKPKAFVHSYGCQQNVSDGERIKGVLSDIGYEIVEDPEESDLILLNTCAVREHAEQRVLGNVGAYKKLKQNRPNMIIGICGCMTQQQEVVAEIKQSYPYIDLVFGVNGIDKLPQMLLSRLERSKRTLYKPEERRVVVENLPVVRGSAFRAWLPIMNGCDNFCSYCIVPYVRGREISRKPQDILNEFRQLVADGYKEITLLGQNVNSYGKGLEEPCDFSDLLNLLCTVEGNYHIRFMSSHPKDASWKLFDTIAAQDKICNHIHLPVQSGNNRVLHQMNRNYTVEKYLQLIDEARRRIPGVTFSSDIIVGFPGETEEEFNDTLELVKKVGYAQLFTFIYSRRSGTRAAEMEDPFTHAEKANRMSRLLKAQEEASFGMLEGQIGQEQVALAEGPGRLPGTVSFRLRNNLTAEIECEDAWIGKEAIIKPHHRKGMILLADLIRQI